MSVRKSNSPTFDTLLYCRVIVHMAYQKIQRLVCLYIATVPLDLNFTNARAQKATARNIHSNAPE